MGKGILFTPAMLEAKRRGLGAAAWTPDAIEASEAAGQRELAKAATRLPIESNAIVPRERVSELTGIIFGEPFDDLFVNVTLPNGWRIVPTEHAMWSDLLNDSGEKVAAIFYKAAFYDRSARISWDFKALESGAHA